ncbi:hypothetical protein D3C80_1345440 [compost metagenome]
MTRKGRNSMKPIWNAVLSSLVTKAGISTRSGTSAGSATCTFAISMKVLRSLTRVWASMNWWMGSSAFSSASLGPMVSAR